MSKQRDHFSASGPHKKEQSLTIAPALESAKTNADPLSIHTLWLCVAAVLLACLASFVAAALVAMINLFTHLAFYQEWAWSEVTPFGHKLGLWVIALPAVGGLVIGVMARYGSSAIRGHGIPEAMERILEHQSVIPLRMTFLKPLSAAVSIGTGGPFGAEGPIIATGGALGSFIGQVLPLHADERKTLLAAGAAAGMTAIFGSPVSAVLLAIELLLFEYRPKSFLPVALAAATAAAMRIAFGFTAPAFPMPLIPAPSALSIESCVALGLIMGLASTFVTKAVYALEDFFEILPVHWMWWPALGGLAVGVIGWLEPRTLGVGYENIIDILSAHESVLFVGLLITAKFASWSIALGSGTSGGTLAPLFTIGAGCGFLIAKVAGEYFPWFDLDPRLAALVGMAAIFAGASRALLASIVFAFETTRQPLGLLPLLGGCTASYLISSLLMRHSIMTLKMERRGVRVPTEYAGTSLRRQKVAKIMSRHFATLGAEETLQNLRATFSSETNPKGDLISIIVGPKGEALGWLCRDDLKAEARDDLILKDQPLRPLGSLHEDASVEDAIHLLDSLPFGQPLLIVDANLKAIGILSYREIVQAERHKSPVTRTRLFRLRQKAPRRLFRRKS